MLLLLLYELRLVPAAWMLILSFLWLVTSVIMSISLYLPLTLISLSMIYIMYHLYLSYIEYKRRILVCVGRVVSVHIHNDRPNKPLLQVDGIRVIKDQGIEDAPRRTYDHRGNRVKKNEDPNDRHVSLILTSQNREHEHTMVKKWRIPYGTLTPGRVCSNLEIESDVMTSIDFIKLLGHDIYFGESFVDNGVGMAQLRLTYQRVPCRRMDRIVQGLAALMENGKVGVFGRCVRTGNIKTQHKIYCWVTPEWRDEALGRILILNRQQCL
jgi:hypothetical protein